MRRKIYYHYSKEWYCGPDFVPGTHFGTLEAAEDRWSNLGSRGGCVAEVYLHMRNPYVVDDLGDWTQPIAFLAMTSAAPDEDFLIKEWVEARGVAWPAWDEGSYAINEAIDDADDTFRGDLKGLGQAWLDVFYDLKMRGFDGIEYVNRTEDPGSTSRMIFSPKQVEVLGYADLPLGSGPRWWDDVSREGLPDVPPFMDY